MHRHEGENFMVDISVYGEIKIHKEFTKDNHDVIQFIPKGDNYAERNSNLKSMVKDISDALNEREIQRGILIQTSKDFPIPCFIVFDYNL